VAGSIGVAESRSLVALIITRSIQVRSLILGLLLCFCLSDSCCHQGIGASSVLAVGAGSIGDIYRPTERGRAMGIFYAVGFHESCFQHSDFQVDPWRQGALLGPAVSPVVAGIMTECAQRLHPIYEKRPKTNIVCDSQVRPWVPRQLACFSISSRCDGCTCFRHDRTVST
jgi:MFS family permease